MYAELAPDPLASRFLFIKRIHLSDISYWAYWIGLFQYDSLIFYLEKIKPPNKRTLNMPGSAEELLKASASAGAPILPN